MRLLALCHLLIRYGKAGAWRQLGYALGGWASGLRNERGRPSWFRDKIEQPDPSETLVSVHSQDSQERMTQ